MTWVTHNNTDTKREIKRFTQGLLNKSKRENQAAQLIYFQNKIKTELTDTPYSVPEAILDQEYELFLFEGIIQKE